MELGAIVLFLAGVAALFAASRRNKNSSQPPPKQEPKPEPTPEPPKPPQAEPEEPKQPDPVPEPIPEPEPPKPEPVPIVPEPTKPLEPKKLEFLFADYSPPMASLPDLKNSEVWEHNGVRYTRIDDAPDANGLKAEYAKQHLVSFVEGVPYCLMMYPYTIYEPISKRRTRPKLELNVKEAQLMPDEPRLFGVTRDGKAALFDFEGKAEVIADLGLEDLSIGFSEGKMSEDLVLVAGFKGYDIEAVLLSTKTKSIINRHTFKDKRYEEGFRGIDWLTYYSGKIFINWKNMSAFDKTQDKRYMRGIERYDLEFKHEGTVQPIGEHGDFVGGDFVCVNLSSAHKKSPWNDKEGACTNIFSGIPRGMPAMGWGHVGGGGEETFIYSNKGRRHCEIRSVKEPNKSIPLVIHGNDETGQMNWNEKAGMGLITKKRGGQSQVYLFEILDKWIK